MAQIMARLPMVAKRTSNTGAAPTYSEASAIGKMISVTWTPTASNVELYGDDAVAENVTNPMQGTIALNTTTLPTAGAHTMFGATVAAVTPAATGLTAQRVTYAEDEGDFTGFAWIDTEIVNGTKTFITHFLPRVKWQLPARTANTRGNTVQFNTPTTNGTAYYDDEYGALEDQFHYTGTGAQAAAIAKLKELCGITEQAQATNGGEG